jgi:hypothetical protein
LAPSVLTGLWHSLQILLVVNLIHHFWINESGLIDRFAELLTSLLVMLSLVYVDSEVSGDREVQRTMLELLNQLDGFSSDERIKVSPGISLSLCILFRLMVLKCSFGLAR